MKQKYHFDGKFSVIVSVTVQPIEAKCQRLRLTLKIILKLSFDGKNFIKMDA